MTRKRLLWVGIALLAAVAISQPWLLVIIPAGIHAALAVLSNMLHDFANHYERSSTNIGMYNPFFGFLVSVPAYSLDALLNAFWMPSSTTRFAMMTMSKEQIVLLRVWNTIEVAAFVSFVVWLIRKARRPASADVGDHPPG